MLKVIALTGAPRCGKNTVVDLIQKHTKVARTIMDQRPRQRFRHLSFSDPMKEFFHLIVGTEYPESIKDMEVAAIGGKRPRDGYIYMGNMDLHFGGDLWARHSWEIRNNGRDLATYGYEGALYESVGRQGQWDYFIKLRDQGRVDTRLVTIERPGVGWTDNREPIKDPDPARVRKLLNDGSIEDLELNIKEGLVPWL